MINVQPEENCRIDENALLLRCEGSCVQSNENVQVLMAKKWSENGPKMVRIPNEFRTIVVGVFKSRIC